MDTLYTHTDTHRVTEQADSLINRSVKGSERLLSWSEALADYQASGEAHVLVSIIATQGSSPRSVGAKMLVVATGYDQPNPSGEPHAQVKTIDTIGGGQLEYQATEAARRLLSLNLSEATTELKQVPLGAKTAQCCGGHVTLLYEFFPSRQRHVLIFGAGHVAKALVPMLSGLALQLHWIDDRKGMLEHTGANNLRCYDDDDPVAIAQRLLPKLQGQTLMALVLTHDHQLDFDLCRALLTSERLCYLGLIGSNTKAARFRHRLTGQGVTSAQLEPWHCPVGIPEVTGKRPHEVAISIAAQIVSVYQQHVSQPSTHI